MRSIFSVFFFALLSFGGTVVGMQPCMTDQHPVPQSQPVTVEDVDDQITILKQAIDEYNNRAFLFDEKAQSLLSHDFTGYRHAMGMSERCKGIADDLASHLKQLEKQRDELAGRQLQKPDTKPVPSQK